MESLRVVSVNQLLREKQVADRPARIVEHFVDSLAARIAHWDEGLTPELARGFDSSEARGNYLRIQEEFCDLRLCDRRALGGQLSEVHSMLDAGKSEDMAYISASFDSKPDMLFMVAASHGVPRGELLKRAHYLLTGGLSFYKKTGGVIVVDRDGEGFEFSLIQNFQPLPEHLKIGEYFFGKLRTFTFIGSVSPTVIDTRDLQ